MKKVRVFAIVFVIVMAILYGANAYVNHYYEATDIAVDATESTDTVVVQASDDALIFTPVDTDSIVGGIIFYPGGRVEYTAYAPLMQELAENGYLCILPHLTYNLAILEPNAADGFQAMYPEIDNWYMSGHSLGGVIASSYAKKHDTEFNGVIFLASYPLKDLSDTDLSIVSIYGSEDVVLKMGKYEKAKAKLPADVTEYVIDGGNHGQFGCYGAQKGDGTATISNEEQIATTVDLITNAIK